MKINMTFKGGPIHGTLMEMKWVPQVQMIDDPRDRVIHAYVRDEMDYIYDPLLSQKLTAIYDDALAVSKPNNGNVLGEA